MRADLPDFCEETVVFPHVEQLEIVILESTTTLRLMRAFPNLRSLSVQSQTAFEFPEMTIEGMMEVTRENTNLLGGLKKRWTHLTHLQGPVVILYTLALTCKVDHLTLTGWPEIPVAYHVTLYLLHMIHPSHLDMDLPPVTDLFYRLGSVFEVASPTLTRLGLRYRESWAETNKGDRYLVSVLLELWQVSN